MRFHDFSFGNSVEFYGLDEPIGGLHAGSPCFSVAWPGLYISLSSSKIQRHE